MGPRVVIGTMAVACCVALGPGAVEAAEVTDPLTVTAADDDPVLDDDRTAAVEVRNETAVEIDISDRWLEVELSGDEGEPTVTGPDRVSPGRTVTLEIALGEKATPASDAILVIVVPVTDGVGVAQRTTIRRQVASSPGIASWAMTVRMGGWVDGRNLPLDGPCSGLDLGEKGTKEVGVVQSGGSARSVTATCPAGDPHEVELSIDRAGVQAEEYGVLKGTIDLGSTDDAEVTLEITTTTGLLPFLFLLTIGVGVAMAIGRWHGGGRDEQELAVEADLVRYTVDPANAQSADVQFQAAAEAGGVDEHIRSWSVRSAIEEAVDETLATFAADQVRGDPKAVETARASLTEIADLAVAWPEAGTRLGELTARLETLRLMERYWAMARAATIGLAPTGQQLTRPQMSTLQDTAKEAIALAGRIDGRKLDEARRWAENNPHEEDARTLGTALERLTSETSATKLDSIIDEVETARARITTRPRFRELLRQYPAKVAGPGAHEPGPALVVTDSREGARRRAKRMRWTDRAVFVVLVLSGLMAAVVALWDGKALGGWVDWVSVLLWGTGSTLISGVVASALTDLRRSRGLVESIGTSRR